MEIVPLDVKGEVLDVAERIATAAVNAGLEVVLDDRKERAGVKFADADLMGFPYQVILGKRGVKNGVAEVKERASGERTEVPLDEVADWLAERVAPQRA